MYPAVGVHHPLGDLLHYAVYRVPDVGFSGHQGAGREQDHEGSLDTGQVRPKKELVSLVEYLVMQAEHIVIDANVIEFDVPLYVVQDIKHP